MIIPATTKKGLAKPDADPFDSVAITDLND
jgi:hypothetical protein